MEIKITTSSKYSDDYHGKTLRTDLVIDGKLIEAVTRKANSGITSTSFNRYIVDGGFRKFEWSDFNVFKPIIHGKVRLTKNKLIELHEEVIKNIENNLVLSEKAENSIFAN